MTGVRLTFLVGALVTLPRIQCDRLLRIVTREEWVGQHPIERIPVDPASLVVIHHSVLPKACFTRENCSQAMRSMQSYHMANFYFNDIGFNFAIGGDAVYEGRGWQVLGAHCKGCNYNSVGIVFIGNYTENTPSDDMTAMCEDLIYYGVANHHIQPNYQLVGYRQVSASDSPGSALYAVIQKWKHWTPQVSERYKENNVTANGSGKIENVHYLVGLNVLLHAFLNYK